MAQEMKPLAFTAADSGAAIPIQMAPLIDCVFLLICFYLFVSESVKNQEDPTINLPRMSSGVTKAEAPAEVVINLRLDGQLIVDAQAVTLAEVRGFLVVQRQRAGQLNRPLRVVVRADGSQRFGQLDELLSACRDAGLPAIVLRAREADSP